MQDVHVLITVRTGAVLLVRGNNSEPLTLILHGNDDQTSFSIVNFSGKRSDLDLAASVRQALVLQDAETPEVRI